MKGKRKPCATCPWRINAPRQYWDPQHFADIWRNCKDDGTHVMLCHKAVTLPPSARKSAPCQGWIRVIGLDAIGVRILVMQGKVTLEEIKDRDSPKLFPSFASMMRANKISLSKRSVR